MKAFLITLILCFYFISCGFFNHYSDSDKYEDEQQKDEIVKLKQNYNAKNDVANQVITIKDIESEGEEDEDIFTTNKKTCVNCHKGADSYYDNPLFDFDDTAEEEFEFY